MLSSHYRLNNILIIIALLSSILLTLNCNRKFNGIGVVDAADSRQQERDRRQQEKLDEADRRQQERDRRQQEKLDAANRRQRDRRQQEKLDEADRRQQERKFQKNQRKKQQQRQQQQYGGFGGQQQYGGGGAGNQSNNDPSEYYKTLKVKKNASDKDIKSAYRKMALKFHPDKYKDDPNISSAKNEKRKSTHNDKFVKVSIAYDVLSDEKKRKTYDKYGQNGLDALEKGMDPEEAGFGGGGFGGFGGGAGAGGQKFTFSNEDATKMFEQMFGGMGGMGGMGGGRSSGGGGFENLFGGMGGGFGGSGMPNMGGFGGGGGGGQQRQRQQQQQQRQQQQQQRKEPPALAKDDPSGVVPLGRSKFPDSKAKHPWLLLFYDKNVFDSDSTTKKYVSLAKDISSGVLKKAKNNKNEMTFKVGAMDCSDHNALQFCKSKIGKGVDLPAYATVFNGSVNVVTDEDALQNAKKLHDHTTSSLSSIDGLIININSPQHIQQRLLASSPRPGHPSISILLLTDKYETSPLYASLAYKHRMDGFGAFGESRGNNLQLAKQYSLKKYPMLMALISNDEVAERTHIVKYDGKSMDSESLSKWLNGLTKKHFKQRSSDSRRRSRS